jgi:hypothetical protein
MKPAMHSARWSTVIFAITVLSVTAVAPAIAQRGQYFPLHVSDTWVYVVSERDGSESRDMSGVEQVRVASSFKPGPNEVFRVENYAFRLSPAELQFFHDERGYTMELFGEEVGLWYPFFFRLGPSSILVQLPDFGDDCMHGSSGSSVALGPVSVPAGTFHEAITIAYDQGPCMDLGLVSETFAPEVGLIQRRLSTLHGEEIWSLQYAQVNGQIIGGPIHSATAGASWSPTLGSKRTTSTTSTWGAIKSSFAR